MTTADRVRLAAARIREAANAATPGPWVQFGTALGNVADRCTCGGGQTPYGHEYGHEYGCGVEGPIIQADETDATHIALMSPPVALAVADWLDAVAADKTAGQGTIHPRAIDLTNLILGDTP